MKIRVTKASKNYYWYANRIGEVFETEDQPRLGGYLTIDPRDGEEGYIEPEDCEIVESPKAMLKTGMLVETREGNLYLVMMGTGLDDAILQKSGSGCSENDSVYMRLINFNDDLIHKSFSQFSIEKIYSTKKTWILLSFDISKYTLIWEREPSIKVTVEVNGKQVDPSKISKETWESLRK